MQKFDGGEGRRHGEMAPGQDGWVVVVPESLSGACLALKSVQGTGKILTVGLMLHSRICFDFGVSEKSIGRDCFFFV
jgi:hypothetical protein